jgi:copper(I)-binding protein
VRQQNRRAPGLRKMTSVVAGLGAVLFIAGCGAGQITQTNTQNAAVNGATADVGTIAIRDAELVLPDALPEDETEFCDVIYQYPAGASAPIELFIVNEGDADDELVSVTAPVAGNVAVQGDTNVVAGSSLVVGEHARADAGEKLTDPEEVAAAQSSAAPGLDEAGRARIVLEQLTRDIRPGQSVEVTFTFKNAGAVTVGIPTDAPIYPRSTQEHNESECDH